MGVCCCLCVFSIIKLSYPELEGLHPLSYHLILWGGGIGHLKLEQVVAPWSIAVLVEHNGGAGATCIVRGRKSSRNKKV